MSRPAPSCRERLLDELRVARASLLSSFLYGALLDHRAARRDADHDARTEDKAAADDLLDEVTQHALRDVVVRDDALAQRTDGDDVARRAADHAARLLADGENAVRVLVHRDDRRLAQHDALPFYIDQHVGCAKVDADIH